MRPLLTFAALALAFFSASCSNESVQAAPEVLRFTAIPDDNATELQARFAPLAEHLSSELGMTVEYVPTVDYAASVNAFKNGEVHLAWFGGLTGVQARSATPGSRAIAQGKVDPQYKSYFIANAASGLEPGDDFPMAIAEKKFTFGSDASTSGRLMPEHFIREASGKSPEEFFGAANNFSGSHDKTAAFVTAGTFDCGALSYTTYDRLVREKKLDPALCRIIWTTPTYADYNWTAHPALGADLTDKLQAILVGIKDPVLLASVDRQDGIIKATNADFDAIRERAIELGFLRE